MKLDVNSLKLGILFFLPYTAFLGVPALPTWRIFNILFVVISMLTLQLKEQDKQLYSSTFIKTQWIFFTFCLFQVLVLSNESRVGTYEIIFLFSLLMIFGLCFFFFQLINNALYRVLKVMELSVWVLFAYQLFQEFVFLIGKHTLGTILNEKGIENVAVFYRVIGPVIGPPGFMAESGHVALFIGPLMMILMLLNHYHIIKVPNRFVLLCLLSLVICLSGGAVIHFLGIGLILMLINIQKINIKALSITVLGFVLIGTLVYLNPAYSQVIAYRVQSIFSGDSERFRGAVFFLQLFNDNFWLGYAPKASRFFSADPNVFIPVMLADHGIIGTLCFMAMWFVPILSAAYKSERKWFLIPFFALTLHLFLAYGTYAWSIIWINYVLILWALLYKPETVFSSVQNGKSRIVSVR